MGRQQLAKKVVTVGLGAANTVQPQVQVLHQLRQLAQEDLPVRRCALGLHAHHQFTSGVPQALGQAGLGAVLRGAGNRPAPVRGQETAQVVRHRQALQRAVELD